MRGRRRRRVYSSLDDKTRLTYNCKMHTTCTDSKVDGSRLPDPVPASGWIKLLDTFLVLPCTSRKNGPL